MLRWFRWWVVVVVVCIVVLLLEEVSVVDGWMVHVMVFQVALVHLLVCCLVFLLLNHAVNTVQTPPATVWCLRSPVQVGLGLLGAKGHHPGCQQPVAMMILIMELVFFVGQPFVSKLTTLNVIDWMVQAGASCSEQLLGSQAGTAASLSRQTAAKPSSMTACHCGLIDFVCKFKTEPTVDECTSEKPKCRPSLTLVVIWGSSRHSFATLLRFEHKARSPPCMTVAKQLPCW